MSKEECVLVAPPWRLVVGIGGVQIRRRVCFCGAPVVIGSVEEEGFPKCAAPPSRLVVEMYFFFFRGAVLRPAVVLHLRTLRRRTCNLRLYAPP